MMRVKTFLNAKLAEAKKLKPRDVWRLVSLHLGLLFINVCWGTNAWVAPVALAEVTPFVYHTFRCVILTPLLLGWCLWRERPRLPPDSWRQLLFLVLVSLLTFGLPNIFYFYGLMSAGPVLTGLLTPLAPILAFLLSVTVRTERANRWKLIGLSVCVCGTLLVLKIDQKIRTLVNAKDCQLTNSTYSSFSSSDVDAAGFPNACPAPSSSTSLSSSSSVLTSVLTSLSSASHSSASPGEECSAGLDKEVIGALWLIASWTCTGLGLVFSKPLVKAKPAMVILCYNIGIGGFPAYFYLLFELGTLQTLTCLHWPALCSLLYATFFSVGVPSVISLWAIKQTTPSVVASYGALVPLVVFLEGLAFADWVLTWHQVVGGAVTTAGLAFLIMGRHREQRVEAAGFNRLDGAPSGLAVGEEMSELRPGDDDESLNDSGEGIGLGLDSDDVESLEFGRDRLSLAHLSLATSVDQLEDMPTGT